MSRSRAALIIALLIHIVLFLLYLFLWLYTPKNEHVQQKKEETRIKVSLKENPKAVRDAMVKNKEPIPPVEAPPMPKGSQLKKLVNKPFIKAKPEKEVDTQPTPKVTVKPKEQKPLPKPKSQPLPPTKKEPLVKKEQPKAKTVPVRKETKKDAKSEHNATKETEEKKPQKVPDNNSELFAKLSEKTDVNDDAPSKNLTSSEKSQITQNIKELYGDLFGKLSPGEQKYILDNQEIMRRITQQVLNRVGRINIPRDLRVNRSNVVQFYLHPNGDITDLKLISKSGFYILDETTKETIEYAYSRYPRPQQKTLIRYKVFYNLRGY